MGQPSPPPSRERYGDNWMRDHTSLGKFAMGGKRTLSIRAGLLNWLILHVLATRNAMIALGKTSFIGLFCLDLAFWIYYGSFLIANRAAHPNGAFVIPFYAHGTDVYISRLDYLAFWGSGILLLIFGGAYSIFYLIESRHDKAGGEK